MIVQIEIKNCQDCPYSWPGDTKNPHQSWVCDKLQDNIGKGDTVSDRCPLKGE